MGIRHPGPIPETLKSAAPEAGEVRAAGAEEPPARLRGTVIFTMPTAC